MLPKRNRADKNTVEKIFKEGKFINSQNISFKYILDKDFIIPHISFIAPKSMAKKAVDRNFLRRRGYFILKRYFDTPPLTHCWCISFWKKWSKYFWFEE